MGFLNLPHFGNHLRLPVKFTFIKAEACVMNQVEQISIASLPCSTKLMRVAQLLLWINATTWVVIGILSGIRLPKGEAGSTAAGVMLGLMAVLAANLFLSVMDQLGWIDQLVLLLNAILLVLLFSISAKFLSKSRHTKAGAV
jgi:hypothetical protein